MSGSCSLVLILLSVLSALLTWSSCTHAASLHHRWDIYKKNNRIQDSRNGHPPCKRHQPCIYFFKKKIRETPASKCRMPFSLNLLKHTYCQWFYLWITRVKSLLSTKPDKRSTFSAPGGCVCSGGVSAPRGVSVPRGGVCSGVCSRGGVCSQGGVCSWEGVSTPRGSAPRGWWYPRMHWGRHPHPPVNRMTDRCKNITLATTSLGPVIKNFKNVLTFTWRWRHALRSAGDISRNWKCKDVYRKIRNNQQNTCIFEVNYYLSVYTVHFKLALFTDCLQFVF